MISKEYLKQMLEDMRKMASHLKIEFNEKTQLIPIKNGLDYLGWRFILTKSGKVIRKIRTSSKKRLYAKIKRLRYDYSRRIIDLNYVRQVVANISGHLSFGSTWNLQRYVYNSLKLQRSR